jgi:hypothetical protein
LIDVTEPIVLLINVDVSKIVRQPLIFFCLGRKPPMIIDLRRTTHGFAFIITYRINYGSVPLRNYFIRMLKGGQVC